MYALEGKIEKSVPIPLPTSNMSSGFLQISQVSTSAACASHFNTTQAEWLISKQLVKRLDMPSQTHTASWQSFTTD